MRPDDVHERVDAIAWSDGDNEEMHSAEDQLHQDVLRAIAEGTAADPAGCAAAALATLELDFERWYA